MTDIRQKAIFILQEVLEEQKFFNEVKNSDEDITSQEMAFLNMLCLTTFRNLCFIDQVLKHFVKRNQHGFSLYTLILATTELLYLDTPDYAVINSYVEILKNQTNEQVSGFVNAVLRNITREKEEILAQDDKEFFPASFLKILRQDYDKETITLIEEASLQEPLLDISNKAGESIRLENNGRIDNVDGYNEGTWWVQDFAASIAAKTITEPKGKRILDICAAPGGKTAQLIASGAKVSALDISDRRLDMLEQNLYRLDMQAADIICQDGIEYLQNYKGELFDAILLDAPCSAIGTLRRHPEIVHIKDMEDVKRQMAIQTKFLYHIKNALKIGGELVYCTCSLSKSEGEKQISVFMKNNDCFEITPIENPEFEQFKTKSGFLRTLPQQKEQGCDGFFIAKLKRIA